MTSPDKWVAAWKKAGALVICRHDFSREGLIQSVILPAPSLTDCVHQLYDAGYYLLDLSTMEVEEGFLVTYHFDSLSEPGRLALRVLVKKDVPELPSIYNIYQGAEWHERESYDFYGIRFIGNPNLIPLLLPEDFSGPPPLRKAPTSLASISSFNLFGQPEILDSAWSVYVTPVTAQSTEKQ